MAGEAIDGHLSFLQASNIATGPSLIRLHPQSLHRGAALNFHVFCCFPMFLGNFVVSVVFTCFVCNACGNSEL
jgi:hypothetical protein